ncbi:heavy metal-binding domain-containing protein [Rhodococcus antarcticus]|uniref:Heavy metal-binding domain-containing protein n=1 Tax=Rhodococcus antarcticus TaxID=2987751 RepID=A0ABY6P0K2_9NOCA|nr:heavy metal-binding domain-containing protein [Rhodococcus antarcticus]UZJ25194.1 heavy metal-binding domain-containing protein [Rhodococcus antarcticus]
MADGTPERDAESARRLESGSLPVVADDRLAQLRRTGAFTSQLATSEFATLRAAGFDPVGQVMGTSVYRLGYIPYTCSYGFGLAYGAGGGRGGYRPGSTTSVHGYVQALHRARELALGRLVDECRALGGDGVVGVTAVRLPFPGVSRTFEFSVTGTAVRARGQVRPRHPFTSDLSGQDVASLLRAGYVPTTLAYGISVGVRHDDWRTTRMSGAWAGNVEIPGYTELVNDVRHWARQDFTAAVALSGGENAVLRDTELEIWEQEPSDGHRDHFAIATLVGTGIARFTARPVPPPAPLTILRLDSRPSAARTATTTRGHR